MYFRSRINYKSLFNFHSLVARTTHVIIVYLDQINLSKLKAFLIQKGNDNKVNPGFILWANHK